MTPFPSISQRLEERHRAPVKTTSVVLSFNQKRLALVQRTRKSACKERMCACICIYIRFLKSRDFFCPRASFTVCIFANSKKLPKVFDADEIIGLPLWISVQGTFQTGAEVHSCELTMTRARLVRTVD